MTRFILLTYALFLTTLLIGQSRIVLRYEDFTFQDKPSKDGKILRESFALAVSNSSLPVDNVTRENLDIVFSKEAEERNFAKDSGKDIRKPNIAIADYLVTGNYTKLDGGNSYSLNVNFVSIKSSDVTVIEKSFRFDFTSEEMSSLEPKVCYEKFKKGLEQLRWDGRAGFLNEEQYNTIQNLDSTVAALQKKTIQNDKIVESLSNSVDRLSTDNEIKEKQINKLLIEVEAIRDYGDMATFTVRGLPEMWSGKGDIIYSSELSNLMDKVLKESDGKFTVLIDDEASIAIETVLLKFPRFPFGYWAKAKQLQIKNDLTYKEYAKKAKEILLYTTKIQGHNINHDQCLIQVNSMLGEN